jgi:hypothetical protein
MAAMHKQLKRAEEAAAHVPERKKGQSLRCSSIDYFQALVEKKKTASLLMVYRLQTRGSRSS